MSERVFVSSTTIDLERHRTAVVNSLRRLRFDVESMDAWPGDPSPPSELSVRRVEGADLFVLLVAFRRGHVPAGQPLSITQQEYQQARSLGLDCLVFMLKEGTPWIAGTTSGPGTPRWSVSAGSCRKPTPPRLSSWIPTRSSSRPPWSAG